MKTAVMKTIHILTVLLILFSVTSCEKDIDFSGEMTAPQLVINSFVSPDTFIVANITQSRFFLDDVQYGEPFKPVENAEVEIFVDDVFKEKMTPGTTAGTWTSQYKPSVGETIRLNVSAAGFKTAWCETRIEQPTTIIAIDSTVEYTENFPITMYIDSIGMSDTIGYQIGRRYHFSLRFKDSDTQQNYYRLLVKNVTTYRMDTIKWGMEDYYFEFTDVVSGESSDIESGLTGSTWNPYHVFSDELFNGKEYPLKFSCINMNSYYLPPYKNEVREERKIYVELQSISKSYYLYLKTRPASGGYDPFSEPVKIHNNVHDGIGIMGSFSSSRTGEINLSF